MTQWVGTRAATLSHPEGRENRGKTLKDNPRQDFNLILNLDGVVSYSVR